MKGNSLPAVLVRLAGCAAMVLGMSQSVAAPTSLEITGTLLDGSGNRITAPFITFTHGVYNSPTGGTLLATLGPENVHVANGIFLQVFSVDDSLFEATVYLQTNLNGFDMSPRLGVFFNGSYFAASGIASGGPAGAPIFQLLVGSPVPELDSHALLLGGLALVGLAAARRRRASSTASSAPALAAHDLPAYLRRRVRLDKPSSDASPASHSTASEGSGTGAAVTSMLRVWLANAPPELKVSE